MNLLFLTPQLPHPPRQGTAIRNWGLIKSLAQGARHTITLLTFADDTESITPELRAACVHIETVTPPRRRAADRLRDLFLSPLPDLVHRLSSPAFAERLAWLLASQKFDAVFCEGLELAPFLFTTENTEHTEKKTKDSVLSVSSVVRIFDAHNAETILQRRAFENDIRSPHRWLAALYSLIQSRRLARFEAGVCRRADHVTCVSAEDAAALRALAPTSQPVIVPNGIFVSDYSAISQQPREAATRTGHQPSAISNQLVFTGKMDYRPNVDAVIWFAAEIFPLIRRELLNVEFVIVGQKPTAAVMKLRELDGIIVTGAVQDVRPIIASATVYVAPLRMGGGTRFKLLEALALRRAIVSTTIGAEGFAVQSGRELMIADSAHDFAQAAVALLRDGTKRGAMEEAGYEFVRNYDWERIVPKVERLISLTTGGVSPTAV